MAIQKTIFGAKAPYTKQKFDGSLSLQQMPDTSAQATQATQRDIQALDAQYNLDRATAKMEADKRLLDQQIAEEKKRQEIVA